MHSTDHQQVTQQQAPSWARNHEYGMMHLRFNPTSQLTYDAQLRITYDVRSCDPQIIFCSFFSVNTFKLHSINRLKSISRSSRCTLADTFLMILVPLVVTARLVNANVWSYMVFGSLYANWLTLIHSENAHPWDSFFRIIGNFLHSSVLADSTCIIDILTPAQSILSHAVSLTYYPPKSFRIRNSGWSSCPPQVICLQFWPPFHVSNILSNYWTQRCGPTHLLFLNVIEIDVMK